MKIREDEHGFYVRYNGSVYRPQLTNKLYSYKNMWDKPFDKHVGMNVKPTWCYADHIIVRCGEFMEVWHDHGSYVLPKKKTSECFIEAL